MAGNESVLCVPESVRLWMGIEHGFTQAFDYELREMLDSRTGCWIPKDRAEVSPEWKQLIPYCLLMRDGELLSYQRSEACGEARLVGKRAFGIGGHIDQPRDQNELDRLVAPNVAFGAAIRRALWAELGEELEILGGGHLRPHFQGFLYDDDTPVGRVHLGLVYLIELPPHAVVRSVDPAVVDLQWHHPRGYALDVMEGWGAILLDAYLREQILH